MASACLYERPVATPPSLRQQILDWYEKLPSQSHAQILGVPPQTTPEALRAAFFALARRFHPDTLGPVDVDVRLKSQAIFARLTEAYRALAGGVTARGSSSAPRRRSEGAQTATPQTPRTPAIAPTREAMAAAAPVTRGGPAPAPALPPATRRAEPTVDIQLAEAESEIASGNLEAAVIRLQQALPRADLSQRRRIRIALARTFVSQGRWRHNGVSLLNDILRDEPWNAEAAALLGAVFRREGLLTRAEALLARAALADPGNARARAELREVRLALEQRRACEPRATDVRGLMARLLSTR